jgi:hypothetical protein
MILRRIGPLSVAKVSGVLYAIMGLLFGAIVSLISLVAASVRPGSDAGPFAALFGVGAIIWLPLFYGCIGFVASLVMAALYNAVAGMVGGIKLEVQTLSDQDSALR